MRLGILEEQWEKLNKTARRALEARGPEWFEGNFGPSGKALDEDAQRIQNIWIQEAQILTNIMLPWDTAGLGFQEYLADYEYWAKSPFYELHEITLLSLGLEPVEVFTKALDHDFQQKDSPARTYALRRHELIDRTFNKGALGSKTKPAALAEWVNAVDLDVHPGFARMLKNLTGFTQIERMSSDAPVIKSTPTEKSPEPREIASMAKLLTAIAISEFGYDPTDKRSPIPREIQEISDLEGLGVSKDTIRKYLQTGAKYLPDGWKPNK